MKIEIVNTFVEFRPETELEGQQLNEVWNLVLDCVSNNRKLVPVGEYSPGKSDVARFNIEDDR